MKSIIIGFALLIGMGGASWALEPQDVVGTWKLLSSVRQVAGSDKVIDNLGAHPNGVLIITPEHRFIVIFTAAEGRRPATTTEEFAALQKSQIAYSGLATLSPDPDNPNGLKLLNKVDIAWNEEWTGTVQTRFLSLKVIASRFEHRSSKIRTPARWQSRRCCSNDQNRISFQQKRRAQPPANSSRNISSSSHCSSAALIRSCSSPIAAEAFSKPARSRA
jgi:hypothetical protein